MRWPTFTGPASREYLLQPADRPDALDVFFDDGRPFHRMSFTPEANLDRHWCDPDTYRVTYTLRGPGRVRLHLGRQRAAQGPAADVGAPAAGPDRLGSKP